MFIYLQARVVNKRLISLSADIFAMSQGLRKVEILLKFVDSKLYSVLQFSILVWN